MKIAITSPARRFESEIDDREGEALFRKIVGMIAEATIRKGSQPRPGGKALSMGGPAALQPQESAGDQQDPGAEDPADQTAGGADPEAAPVKKQKRHPLGASGFLHIVCPSCGKARTFNAREEIGKYRCHECHARTMLKAPLREVFTRCSCGKNATYRTNATEGRIEVPCIACGELIPCEYSPKHDAFLYVRGGQKAAREAAREAARKAAKKAAKKDQKTGEHGSDPDLITTGQSGQK